MTGLRLSPETLAASYEFLRTTPPFCRWSLPEASEVRFRVAKSPHWYGQCYELTNGRPGIEISSGMVSHTNTLLSVMAHEMIHLKQLLRGTFSAGGKHNGEYMRLAAQVCRVHGLDLKAFWC